MKTVPLEREQPGIQEEIDPALLEPVEVSPDGRAIFAVPFSEDELAKLEAFARQRGTDEIRAIHDLVMSALSSGHRQ